MNTQEHEVDKQIQYCLISHEVSWRQESGGGGGGGDGSAVTEGEGGAVNCPFPD